jgi:NAD(P)-dependent dehydrogenase (short-subunit alcohol dehydrogenase family)
VEIQDMNPRLAVITGSTKGIGEACARRFLAEGLTVVGISTSAPGEPLASHRGYHAVVGDVGDPAAWERVVAIYRDLGMPPTSLVLNAARARIGTVLTVSMETWRQQFEDNFFGAVLGARACLPDMIAAGGGSVVVVSSVNGWLAEQGLIAYSCTKAALIEFARSLAVDHARQGIRVNVVAPGATDTPAFRRAMGTADDPEAWIAERAARNPLGRILSADEVAAVAWFLSTDGSSGMTGAVVAVDAGLSVSFDFRDPEGHGYREPGT